MKRRSPYIAIAVLTPAIIFGGIAGAKALGWWKTTGGGAAPARIAQGGYAGRYDPGDIRGSSTFASIEGFFNVPAVLIAQAFGFEAQDSGRITAKAVDGLYGELTGLGGEGRDVGTDAVKLFVARLTGLPYEPEPDTGLPEAAIDIILTLGPELDQATRADLASRAVAMRYAATAATPTQGQAAPHAPSEQAIEAAGQQPGLLVAPVGAPQVGLSFSGKTSFAEVLAAGLTKAQIEGVIGRPMPLAASSVKDYCESNGLAYSQVKKDLLALLVRL